MIKENKYKISLTTLEPFRIGAKEDPLSGADNPVAKIGGKLAIPGSSLKGSLRNQIESFLIDTYYNKQKQHWPPDKKAFQPCIPGAKLSVDEKKLIGKYRDELGACHYPCTDKKCRGASHPICPVCYLLGSMGLNGFVKVPFLFAEAPTEELQSIRIDRASGTAKEGALRRYELIPDSITFFGELFILLDDTVLGWKLGEPRLLHENTLGDAWLSDNKNKMDEKAQKEFIKTYILDRLEAINRLGGYKSKGFGQVEIKVEPIKG